MNTQNCVAIKHIPLYSMFLYIYDTLKYKTYFAFAKGYFYAQRDKEKQFDGFTVQDSISTSDN